MYDLAEIVEEMIELLLKDDILPMGDVLTITRDDEGYTWDIKAKGIGGIN